MLGPFVATDDDVPDYNPKSDPFVRRDNRRLILENEQLKPANASYKMRFDLLRKQLVNWETQAESIREFGGGQRKQLLERLIKTELPDILNLDLKKAPSPPSSAAKVETLSDAG